jgi:hypothetical protein
VHWPNRLLAEVTGDDGSNKLVFDGKTLTIYSAQDKKYATLSVPEGTTIDGMLKDAVGRHGLNFPLADFLSEAPDRAFLSGVRFVARINIRAQSGPRSDIYVRRTYSGRPSSSIRFSEATAMATSVICRPSVRERSASPITRL